MEQRSGGDGGEVAAKRPNLSSSGEDRLSALPEDILVLILHRLHTITEAARTSVLSRHWRRIWRLLPELTFILPPDDRHIREVLASSEAPALSQIIVVTNGEPPESMTAWLPLAARRLSGALRYHNNTHIVPEEEEVDDAVPLPCFGNAIEIALNLGFLTLALPSSGAFTRLTLLRLDRVRFHGTCELGDIVSSPRCPCLRELRIKHVWGVSRLTVHSKSLLQMGLFHLNGLQKLNIDAPLLNDLTLEVCFAQNRPVANISAPQLISLVWRDAYDPSSVQLGNLEQLQLLSTDIIMVYGHLYSEYNHEILQFLQHFQVIHSLNIALGYPRGISNFQYMMEDMTHLPRVTFLTLSVMNGGHAFAACSFHVLRLCTGIRRLSLVLPTTDNLEEESTCPSGCICDEPSNWKNEELSLNCLRKVEIFNLQGVEHEAAFLEQLFSWAVVLEKLKIIFDSCVSKSKARKFVQRLSSISRPETVMKFCMDHNSDWRTLVVALSRR